MLKAKVIDREGKVIGTLPLEPFGMESASYWLAAFDTEGGDPMVEAVKSAGIIAYPDEDQKAQWSADRTARVERAKEMLAQGLKGLQTDEGWLAMLRNMARIGKLSPARLSFRNQLLVAIQCPTAEYVATYKDWMKYGRKVKPKKDWPEGRESISILRPIVRKYDGKSDEGDDGEEESAGPKKRIFFTTMALFDQDLTEGDPIEDPYEGLRDVHEQEGFDYSVSKVSDLLVSLPDKVVNSIQFVKKHPTSKDTNGWYEPDTRDIYIVTGKRNRERQFSTLIHEAAHAILHGRDDHHNRPEREVEAESVAFVVCEALGLDVKHAAFKYVAIWAGRNAADKDAAKLVMQSGQRITMAANKILDAIADKGKGEGE